VIRNLSEKEYINTFGKKMTDVTETAEPVINIWSYVEELVKLNLVDNYVFENNLVEYVYRNDSSTFEHVLLPTKDENVFIVLVVDLINEALLGYIKLDLNGKYGLK